MTAIALALRAIAALGDGDVSAAQAHLSSARRHAQTASRRDRQVVEITGLVVAGDAGRAAGLAHEHVAEFPGDADLLGLLSRCATARSPDRAQGR